MKRKIIFGIFILILLLGMLNPTKTFAISSKGGYTIQSYDINMVVNENNTFDITETIAVNFTGQNKHGIFRKIPLKNSVTRLDGTESNNRAKISNISVSDPYTASNENGYKVLKIGSSSETVSGRRTYTIKYNYNIGKDPLKDADELYFNLIGDEWDTSIRKVTFTITMPKAFDKSKLGFSSGNKTSTNSSNVDYTVIGNTIKGSLETSLYSGQGLTVRLTLPEGYFVGASSNFDYIMLLEIGISIIFVIVAFCLWNKYGKDEAVVETVEFYPPDGMNSADLGFIYKGHSEQKDIISLLIYLANKGYLRIEEFEEKTLKVIKSKKFKIIKVKEYDGDNEDERTFFNDLFKSKDEVTRSDLYDKFYVTLEKIAKNINRKENQEKIFEKASLGKRIFLIAMIIVVFLFMGGLSIIKVEDGAAISIVGFILVAPLVLLYNKPNTWTIILCSFAYVFVTFFCMATDIFENGIYLVKFIIGSICLVLLIIFLGIIKKRTVYGTEMLGRIQGFKYFLETAEKPQLEELVMREPEYFYNILPYTYVLGVSNKWMKKFEDIALEAPGWYYGYASFDNHSFNRFMNSTYSSISTAMSTSQSDSSGSGGGFSGGGSGGGGRRLLVNEEMMGNINFSSFFCIM